MCEKFTASSCKAVVIGKNVGTVKRVSCRTREVFLENNLYIYW